MHLELHRIDGITDPYLLPALRIYEQAFPLYEQTTTSSWIENLLDRSESARIFVVALDRESDQVAGMAFYETCRSVSQPPVVYLWYLCTRVDLRGQGLGRKIYQMLTERLFATGARAIVFEVERPDAVLLHGPDAAELAARRIRWYQRNGALLLSNVDYLQHVDNGLPPTPMYLMIHPQHALTPEEAFRIMTEEVELKANAIGPLGLESGT
ncbi:MAG: acetyltransferase, N-acetylglutamate synthase [Chthonomonadaceae bacterium]|nr:acetyltransferase, N-acetylglutamate synthase [Chthonomonadaceae bacterium]